MLWYTILNIICYNRFRSGSIKNKEHKKWELRDSSLPLSATHLIYENVVQIPCYNEHKMGKYKTLNPKFLVYVKDLPCKQSKMGLGLY